MHQTAHIAAADALGASKKHLGQADRTQWRGLTALKLPGGHAAHFRTAPAQIHDQALMQADPVHNTQDAVVGLVLPT